MSHVSSCSLFLIHPSIAVILTSGILSVLRYTDCVCLSEDQETPMHNKQGMMIGAALRTTGALRRVQQCRQIMAMRPWMLRCCRSNSSSLSRTLLEQVRNGKLTVNEAMKLISSDSSSSSTLAATNMEVLQSFANLDHSRAKRTGFPEAVFAEGKTAKQVASILDDMGRSADEAINDDTSYPAILATRVTTDMFRELNEYEFRHGTITYHEKARIVSMLPSSTNAADNETRFSIPTRVVVATAGTTDIPIAEEAAVTLEAAGCQVDRLVDVGVAGLHRILRALPTLRHPEVGCVIVCAGMDGALPSVVGGLVSVPVIAVPTSIGYGASFGGVSAMLTMMNSCSPGVAVVNIDNGFGAAALAFKCIRPKAKSPP